MSKKIYFASPLFSEMELQYNTYVASRIREQFPNTTIYLPQEQLDINDKNAYADSTLIAKVDTAELLSSQVLVAVLDGASIDVGVASEIGVAYQAGIPVIGLYTDSRQQGATHPDKLAALQTIAESQFSYINLYTVGLIKLNGSVVANVDALISTLSQYLA